MKVRSSKFEVRSEGTRRLGLRAERFKNSGLYSLRISDIGLRTSQTVRPCTRVGRAAFTLVEIMIAITILTLIITAIYSSWTAILKSSRVGRDMAAAVQRSRMALRVLEDSLTSAQCFAANQRFYGFVAENGNEPTLSFVARLAKSFPRSGRFGDFDVRRVTFSVENENLVLRQVPLVMEADEDEVEHPIILAPNVKEFAMEFWDNRLNDWVDEWKQTNQLPRLISFTIRIADNARLNQPQEEIFRIVSIPAVAVQPVWQAPRVPPGGVPGGIQPGMQPGTPGVVPGGPPGSYPGQPGVLPGRPGVLPGQPGTFTSPGRITPR